MVSHVIKRGNGKLTLSVSKEILKNYKRFCEAEGLIISKQVEKFMRAQLNKK